MLSPLSFGLSPLGATRGVVGYSNPTPAAITPTESAELLLNPGIETWASATDASNWTEDLGAGNSINQESVVVHGGTYSARHAAVNAVKADMLQTVTASAAAFVKMSAWVRKTGGTFALALSNSTQSSLTAPSANNVWQNFDFTTRLTAANPQFSFKRTASSGVSAYLDDTSIKVLSNMMVQEYAHPTPLSYNQCALTLSTRRQSGVYHQHTGSGDYILAYIDNGPNNLYLIKVVSGVFSLIANASFTYAAGNVLKLKHHQTDGWQVFYATPAAIDSASALLTSTIVTDANLNSCNGDGLFSTDAANSFTDYSWRPN